MALRVIRETGRSLGFSKADGATIISGQPLMLASATEVQPYDGTADKQVIGLALEDSEVLPLQGAGGQTAGEGFDYTNFARGGLHSMLLDGGEVELFDDGRGTPFKNDDTYALGEKVFANSNGLITSDSNTGANPEVGVVMDVEGSPVTRLRIKLLV